MGAALIVTDMLNTYEHDDADRLADNVETTVEPIQSLIEAARERDVPLIYVNDNFGDWNSSSEELARRALSGRLIPSSEPDELFGSTR